MAVTTGQGNPKWTTDEILLALDLYFRFSKKPPGANALQVIELSRLLNRLPIHPLGFRKSSFRNPDSVAFKLQNLQSIDKGRGLQNSSKTDRDVWNNFHNNPQLVSEVASRIIDSIDHFPENAELDVEIADEDSFAEGKVYTALHRRRERAPGLRAKLIAIRLARGNLCCEICGLRSQFGSLIDEATIFECHHIIPISDPGYRITRLTDLALLCATCHRAIHAAIRKSGHWLTLEEMRTSLDMS